MTNDNGVICISREDKEGKIAAGRAVVEMAEVKREPAGSHQCVSAVTRIRLPL